MQEWRKQQSEEYALAKVQVPEVVAERVQQAEEQRRQQESTRQNYR
ncbi:hypothetical protein [Halomonas sp. AOP35-4E-18]